MYYYSIIMLEYTQEIGPEQYNRQYLRRTAYESIEQPSPESNSLGYL